MEESGEFFMFVGSSKHSVDAKGRIALPAKLRKNLSPDANGAFMMTRGMGGCIDLYPMNEWNKLYATRIANLNPFDPKDAMFIRIFLDDAAEDTLDSQSRLLIPKLLLEAADIEKEAYIKGATNKIEVWNPDKFEEYRKEASLNFEEIAKEVMTRQL